MRASLSHVLYKTPPAVPAAVRGVPCALLSAQLDNMQHMATPETQSCQKTQLHKTASCLTYDPYLQQSSIALALVSPATEPHGARLSQCD